MKTYLIVNLRIHLRRNKLSRTWCLLVPSLCGADDIVGRYDDLSKSVNERNEKLQITLTRSLSVQDGLNEMLDWMGSVESSLVKQGQVPLNSAALQDLISKNIVSDLFWGEEFYLQLKTNHLSPGIDGFKGRDKRSL